MPTTSTFWRFTSPSILLRICSGGHQEKNVQRNIRTIFQRGRGVERYSSNSCHLLPIVRSSRRNTETCRRGRMGLPPSSLLDPYLTRSTWCQVRVQLALSYFVPRLVFTRPRSLLTLDEQSRFEERFCYISISFHSLLRATHLPTQYTTLINKDKSKKQGRWPSLGSYSKKAVFPRKK